ncbi:restriction endonuclease subunit S [Cysteiniphilum sp. QT6929]|uniref:restriction endonuclease subunit S n=1 Tax=Cysteiniphilum sp. QT6929 TaxID=2975055 RepID=UPI0024B3637F|nr:restriction endonuclease subunit S [Cysteiniphilum sp. QT6929]WHN66064.1 restriction endonuclease subunit S [Cysteiniphilum sp. QT6929]
MTGKLKPYPQYKDSDVEWLGEVPEEWRVIKIGNLFLSIGSGTTPISTSKEYYEGGLIPWVNTGDLNDGYLEGSKRHITEKALEDFSTLKVYPKGSIIIAMYGATIGKLTITTSSATTNQACCVLEPAITIDSKYIFYCLLASRNYIIDLAYGAGQPNISQETIRSLKLPVPITKEQTTIANYLDQQTVKINQLIENYQKLIALSKEKRTALITHCVTKGLDPTIKMKDSGVEWLGEVPEHWIVDRVKSHFKIEKRISGSLDYDVLSITQKGIVVKDIDSGEGQLSMDYSKYQLIFKGEFGMNHMDLLTGYIDISKYNGVVSPDYRVFSIKNQIFNTNFYLYVFQTCYINKIFYKYGQGSSQLGRWRLPSEEFYGLRIPTPFLDEQMKISNYLDQQTAKIDQTIEKAERAIELLKEKRTALITAVVTGKVDVRECV